ncbi:MAG: MarR family transcriptional regulator [Pseudomonadota bacterium]|nr:MarR family transcriptional regulator [Pseudomonadota bacterium]
MSEIYDAKTVDPKIVDPKTGVGGLLARVRVKILDALDQELAPFDITAAQYVILKNLANGVDSASGLCRDVSYDPGAMTRMIDRLERKGLVRRLRTPEDRRVVKVELTQEGKAVYPKLAASAATALSRKMRGFTEAEVRQLEGFLRRILAND